MADIGDACAQPGQVPAGPEPGPADRTVFAAAVGGRPTTRATVATTPAAKAAKAATVKPAGDGPAPAASGRHGAAKGGAEPVAKAPAKAAKPATRPPAGSGAARKVGGAAARTTAQAGAASASSAGSGRGGSGGRSTSRSGGTGTPRGGARSGAGRSGGSAGKAGGTGDGSPAVPPGTDWTPDELAGVRADLAAQLTDLREQYRQAMEDLNTLQQSANDGAGDDQADAGTKTFEREQELSIANNRLDLLTQMERAIERLDAATYGRCESCGNPIPKARLQAFPSATLCVTCKQREERR